LNINLGTETLVARADIGRATKQPTSELVARVQVEARPGPEKKEIQRTTIDLAANRFHLKKIEYTRDPELKIVEGEQLYCKSVTEFRDFIFVPPDPVGEYTIQVSGEATDVSYTFDLLAPTDPIIFYADRAGGYVLAGFGPSETVRVLEYSQQGQFIREHDSQSMDGNGVLLLPHVSQDVYLFAVRGDFSFVPTTIYVDQGGLNYQSTPFFGVSPLDYDLIVEQNPDNPHAYYQRGLNALRPLVGDREQAVADFQMVLELAGSDQQHLRDLAQARLTELGH
jgi:hypothetical protein